MININNIKKLGGVAAIAAALFVGSGGNAALHAEPDIDALRAKVAATTGDKSLLGSSDKEAAALRAKTVAAASGETALLEGERLYAGKTSFEQAGSLEIRFVLSADKSEIKDLAVIITDLKVEGRYDGNKGVRQTAAKATTMYANSFPVRNRKADVSLEDNGSLSIEFGEGGAAGTIDYTYIIGANESRPAIPVKFGKKPIRFKVQK